MNNTVPKKLILKIRDLPTLPRTVSTILSLASDPRSTASAFQNVIEKDQVLTARLLKIVNSAVFGLNRKIASIQEAVVLLGIHRIKEISSAVSLGGLYQPQGEVNGVDLWIHALATAQWTKEIIAHLGLVPDDELYTASLIHDLGILVMAQFLEDEYNEVLDLGANKKQVLYHVEQKFLGVTHAEVGGTLCAKWNFPPAITKLVREHHSPKHTENRELAILKLADSLAAEIGLSNFTWEKQIPLNDDVFEKLDIDECDIEKLLESSTQIFEYISIFED